MHLDQILRRHFWAVLTLLTGAASFFGAQGVTQLVGAGLAVDDTQLAAPPLIMKSASAATATTVRTINAEPILSRNPFDSQAGPLNKVDAPPEEVAATPPDLSDPMAAPICDGVRVLVITASTDPEWSFAALSGGSDGAKSSLLRRGADFNGKTVFFVGWDRVWLQSANQLCQAQMFRSANAPPPTPPPSTAPPPPSGGSSNIPPDIAKGIVKVGATEFNVDRGVVDKILENQAELMRSARIVPEQENGKVVGIRMFGVRPDTLLGVLGMENGDRLQQINGFDMASPEKALEAYARLRTADHLTVQLNRRGQPVNLDFNIK